MNKKKYESASLEVILFDAKDVITTSGAVWGGNSGDPIVLPGDIF